MTSRAVLVLTCADRPGIVADVAGWITASGGNIVEAAQHSDATHNLFLQRVEVDHDQRLDDLRRSFAEIAERWQMRWEIHEPPDQARLAVLVSRESHCLYDLLGRCATGDLPARVELVASNHADLAPDAERFGVTFHHLPVSDDRHSQEQRLSELLEDSGADLVVLARYMRVLSGAYCERWGDRTINIHHSFLPAFIGADAYRQAHDRGVKLIGATAHYVTEDLDEGPIIAQDVVRVSHADTPETMARRGRDLESLVLATAVRAHLERRVLRFANRTVVFD